MITLTQKTRTRKRGSSRKQNPQEQPTLFDTAPAKASRGSGRAKQKPAISAKLSPNSHHHSKCDRYWVCCNHLDKQFGGLYYRAEIDYILKHFSGRTGLIEPREFDPIAERAVAISTGRAA